MNPDARDRETVLAEASRAIRSALLAQRHQLAAQIRPDLPARTEFPRSVTMRLIMLRPAQSTAWLVALLRSRRLGRSLFAMLALGLVLRAIRLALIAPAAPVAAIAAPTPDQNELSVAPRLR